MTYDLCNVGITALPTGKLLLALAIATFCLTKFIYNIIYKAVASGTQENHSRARTRIDDSLAHRRIIASAARLPPPVFTGAAPLG